MEASKLNTTNPECITWQYEELLFTVLGGIRLDYLDRLRVTIKIEFKRTVIRHNLDLYNDTQTDKLIKKCAERFEIGTVYITKALGEFINELERYRLLEIQQQNIKQEIKQTLTAEEVRAARAFLQQEKLLERTNDYIGKSGVVGEEHNRLLMYLIFTSRLMQRPLHIVSFGSSGAGKSHLQEKVGELIPTEHKIEITSLTGNAFYYFDKDELGHKLVLIEDLDGVLAALYPMRELQSKQKISKTVTIRDKKGNAKTIRLVVYGPVCIAGCTTQERIYEDNANRSFLIFLDESKEQDEKIMHYQRLLSAGKINFKEQKEAQELLKNVQRTLEPITVINPYAEQLKIPQEVFKPRRTNAHYLGFIEAITFYHQQQREQKIDEETGELFIETTIEDIELANTLIKDILLRKSDEISGACRSFFEKVKQHLKAHKQTTFTNKEIRETLRENPSNQKRYMIELQQYGHIRKLTGNQKKGFYYEVQSMEEYKTLENRINNVLDEVLQEIRNTKQSNKVVQSSQAVFSTSEPLKIAATQKSKVKNKAVHQKIKDTPQ